MWVHNCNISNTFVHVPVELVQRIVLVVLIVIVSNCFVVCYEIDPVKVVAVI